MLLFSLFSWTMQALLLKGRLFLLLPLFSPIAIRGRMKYHRPPFRVPPYPPLSSLSASAHSNPRSHTRERGGTLFRRRHTCTFHPPPSFLCSPYNTMPRKEGGGELLFLFIDLLWGIALPPSFLPSPYLLPHYLSLPPPPPTLQRRVGMEGRT